MFFSLEIKMLLMSSTCILAQTGYHMQESLFYINIILAFGEGSIPGLSVISGLSL